MREKTKLILDYIKENPGCTVKDIQEFSGLTPSGAQKFVEQQMKKERLTREGSKPYYYRIKEKEPYKCPVSYSNTPQNKPSLENYTPRELMLELRARGYTGKLKLVRISEIDLDRL